MHVPVLPDQVLDYLRVHETGTYVDCTAGYGGHAVQIADKLKGGRLIALDRDPSAVAALQERFGKYAWIQIYHSNYAALYDILHKNDINAVDGILLDAGVSSPQINHPERGFSFQENGPLDMRMDTSQDNTAADLLNTTDEHTLVHILRDFGDVGPAGRIAHTIIHRAQQGKMRTTFDLRAAVIEALPFIVKKRDPDELRTVFQAIRMAVNNELENLEKALIQAIYLLRPEGRLVVISFHSGEDRIVKKILHQYSREQKEFLPDGRVCHVKPACLRVLTRKPIRPDDAECKANPRACSARLRAAERLGEQESA